jgi:hypothetical protein
MVDLLVLISLDWLLFILIIFLPFMIRRSIVLNLPLRLVFHALYLARLVIQDLRFSVQGPMLLNFLQT